METSVCEASIRGCCNVSACPNIHSDLPYVWQVDMSSVGGTGGPVTIPSSEAVNLEKCYCNPAFSICTLELTLSSSYGESIVTLTVHFPTMYADFKCSGDRPATERSASLPVRRLSTPSYAASRGEATQRQVGGDDEIAKFWTQWRWYYLDSKHPETWRPFGESTEIPAQCVLEKKLLHGRQKLYLFEQKDLGEVVIDLEGDGGKMKALRSGLNWSIIRRPLFISAEDVQLRKFLVSPPMLETEFSQYLTPQWSPVDPTQEAELVPISPDTTEYHLVASEFHKTLQPTSRRIFDILRVQNPFLWHKYASKKLHMLRKLSSDGSSTIKPSNIELRLFHGTGCEKAVCAIVRENFDWRIAGSANAAIFGQGTYFAMDANYSDKYALVNNQSTVRNWMFFARVLVGRSTQGSKGLLRPPPIHYFKPNLGSYDSCVDNTAKPKIFVIFDCDQCYPEYMISYGKV